MMLRWVLFFLFLFSAFGLRKRADPNGWFADLVAADADHDHSGDAAPRPDHLCCHRMAFDEDPLSGDRLANVQVPYNYWWRTGSTLLSVSPSLDEPAARMLDLGNPGLMLNLVDHSRLYLRLQCAFPCCLEAIEILAPDGAAPLVITAGNATHEAEPWRLNRTTLIPPGFVSSVGSERWSESHGLHELLWADKDYTDRLSALRLCDHATTGTWIRIDSPSRVWAAVTELDLCFVHHDLFADWETNLCSEIIYY